MTDEIQDKVLFVDDEESILSSLRRGLIDEDYECIFASNGLDALEILKTQTVSVIVSDMRMPGMDGLTLLKIVKEKYPKTVRIVLSGYAQLQQVIATVNQADVFKFITKPWKLEEEFISIIRQALDYYRLQFSRITLEEVVENQKKEYKKLLDQFDTVTKESKKNMDKYSNIGFVAVNSILKGFNDTGSAYAKENEKNVITLIKRKLETAATILKLMATMNQGEEIIKPLTEYLHEMRSKELTRIGVKLFDIDNKSEITDKNNKFLASLINEFVFLFSNDNNDYAIKIAVNSENIDNIRYSIVSIIISNISDSYSKNEYEQYQDACLEIMIPLMKQIMGLLKGNFQCARFENNIVTKIWLP